MSVKFRHMNNISEQESTDWLYGQVFLRKQKDFFTLFFYFGLQMLPLLIVFSLLWLLYFDVFLIKYYVWNYYVFFSCLNILL